ncbi:MAG TPA: SpoIIE family protein phosphatase [Tissierellaceae bacterium]|nr:SpoIIE family protein phosphatase [Tissierellaceae bacterium]
MLRKNKLLDRIHKSPDYSLLNYHVLEGMADWVRVIDRNGIVIYANTAMKEDLGEDIVGSKCYESICNVEKCDFCITNRSMVTGEIVQKEEVINGNYYSVKSSPVRNGKGEIFAAVEVFRNVTRERKLELELINKNKKMNEDLQFAKRIQEKILPSKGRVGNLRFDYVYKPSEMLSGDMFDIYRIDDKHIGIYISDVAGNGVAASMMTMFIHQMMRVMKEETISPSKTLSNLHKRFLSLNLGAENYFTIFYAVYNKESKILKYANAGHNCIPIKFNGGDIKLLENKGFPITMLLNNMEYEEKEVRLKNRDKILFYTDGVTEARDYSGKEFGLDNIIRILKSNTNNILDTMEDEVINFSWGEHIDDLAIVLLEVLDEDLGN